MNTNQQIEIGDTVIILPGQQLGKKPTNRSIVAVVAEKYEWSYTGLSSLLVRCKPKSRTFMVNLKHGEVYTIGVK